MIKLTATDVDGWLIQLQIMQKISNTSIRFCNVYIASTSSRFQTSRTAKIALKIGKVLQPYFVISKLPTSRLFVSISSGKYLLVKIRQVE